MFLRIAFLTVAVSASSLAAPSIVFGQKTLSIGDRVVLDLTDKAAVAWFDFISAPFAKVAAAVPGGRVGMPLEASVVAMDNDEVTVEYYAMSGRDSDSPSIVTITASVSAKELRDPSPFSAPDGAIQLDPDTVTRARRRLAALSSFRVTSTENIRIRKWKPLPNSEGSEQ